MARSYTEHAGEDKYDWNTSISGLSAATRIGEDFDEASGSTYDRTGTGGSGYEDGAIGKPSSGSSRGVTISGRIETLSSNSLFNKQSIQG